jgi:acid phosphatase family membrane protein YuiD
MIQENLAFLLENLSGVWKILLNRVMILSCSSQIMSMFVKALIKSVKNKKFSLKEMASYGGMPSSHTAFIVSATLGLGVEYGWNSAVFGFGIVSALIVLVDAVKLRGTIDRVNERSSYLAKDCPESEVGKKPKFIAHKFSEVIGGIIFAVIYTFLFYLFFKGFFDFAM